MEDGQDGHLGQAVEVIVRCQDTEVAQIQFLPMEEMTVWATLKKINPALEEDVKLMEDGDLGHLGQAAKVIVKCQDTEYVTTQLHHLGDWIV